MTDWRLSSNNEDRSQLYADPNLALEQTFSETLITSA